MAVYRVPYRVRAHVQKRCAVAEELLAKGAEAVTEHEQKQKRGAQQGGRAPAADSRHRSTVAQPAQAAGAASKRPSSRTAPRPGRGGGACSAAGAHAHSAPSADQTASRRQAGPESPEARSAHAAADGAAGVAEAAPAAETLPCDGSPDDGAAAGVPGVLGVDDAKHFVDHVEDGDMDGGAQWGEGVSEASDAEEGGEAGTEEDEAAAAQTEVKRAANQWRRDYQALATRARQLVERRRQLAWARASLTAQFLTRRSRLAAKVELEQAALLQAWADRSGMLRAA